MSNPETSTKKPREGVPSPKAALPALVAAALFGLAFGFLLQKGGVGKYHILVGQLLLQDFTVAKVMLTAIVTGMIGVLTLHHFGKIKLHLKPTRVVANVIGGLIFGAGFALMGYCPGTAAAALGQGSWDAAFGMVGLVAGSWLFAEISGWSKRNIEQWGDYGKIQLPDLLSMPRGVFIVVFAVLLIGFLVVLEMYTIR